MHNDHGTAAGAAAAFTTGCATSTSEAALASYSACMALRCNNVCSRDNYILWKHWKVFIMLSETLYQVSLIPWPVLRRSLFRLGSVQGRVTADRDASLDVSQAQLSRCSWPRASRFQSHATSLNTIHSEPHSQVFDQSASNRAKTHLRLRSHTRATTRLPSKPLQDACSAVLRAAREYKT